MAAISSNALLANVELEVCVRFGTNQLPLREILQLESGALISLVEPIAELVELLVGGRVIARGELLSIDGGYGFEVVEVVSPVE
jgi:flagellar motor switch protein FliN/FliY